MKVFALKDNIHLGKVEIKEPGRIVSVFLEKNENLLKHNFHCIGCGYIRFQYSGDVFEIFDGAAISKEKATVDILCKMCRVIYRTMELGTKDS